MWDTIRLPRFWDDPDFTHSSSEDASETDTDSNSSVRTLSLNNYEPSDVLQHGRKYSSDEDGDGPSLDKAIFLGAWPYIATWIRQNRRAGNLSVAHYMCAAQYLYILKVAFMRLHFKKMAQREGFGDNLRFFDEGILNPEDPYRGWDVFSSYYLNEKIQNACILKLILIHYSHMHCG